jgi:hypothetical protein
MRAFSAYAGGVITPFLFEAQYCSNWRALVRERHDALCACRNCACEGTPELSGM